MSSDLFNIDLFDSRTLADEGVEFQLRHPVTGPVTDKKGKRVWIKLGGFDGARMRQTIADGRKERSERIQEVRKADPEFVFTQEMHGQEDLALMTLGWSDNWCDKDGNKVQCTFENALALYKKYPEIAEQMIANVSNRANFMPAGSSS